LQPENNKLKSTAVVVAFLFPADDAVSGSYGKEKRLQAMIR